jgi:small subunit ribosomal protein S1
MVSKKIEVHPEQVVPEEPDEGWWDSVLSDEESYVPGRPETTSAKTGAPSLDQVDWDYVQTIFDRDDIVKLQVYGCNRGGLLVQGDSLQGFVPVSHLVDIPSSLSEEERQTRLSTYVGRTLLLKVIECEPSLERIVLSERAAQAGEGRRKVLFKTLKPGEMIQGTVTNVTDFGVFVDLGGVEGLIHVSELSWGRVQHPSDVCQVGQLIRTLVLQVCEENSRVALSLKQLEANPWDQLVEAYKPGDIVTATITSIMRFGAFARLGEGVEGLIHISSMMLPPEYKTIESYLETGQVVQVRILHIEASRRRLGLGLVTTG